MEHDQLVDEWIRKALILPLCGKAGVIRDCGTCLDAYIRLDHQNVSDLRAGIGKHVLAQSFCCWIYDYMKDLI